MGEPEDPFTPEFEHPEEEVEDTHPDEAETELTEVVTTGASDLRSLAATQLTQALESRVIDASTQVKANPLEGISDPTKSSPRLDALEGRRDQALGAISDTRVQDAHVSLLEALFGVDLSGLKPEERRANATTLLTHLVYSATGKPLPETLSSAAAKQVADVVGDFKALSDDDYWLALADAFEGDTIDGSGLDEHLVFMGLTAEMKPLTDSFMWHNADQIALHVDELIEASRSTGLRAGKREVAVDIAGVYRRAAMLVAGAKPLPRAVVAELVRLAVAELRVGIAPGVAPVETPSPKTLDRFLKPETVPDGATPQETVAANARNLTRTAATMLASAVGGSGLEGSTPLIENLRTTTRLGRGYLTETLAHQVAEIRNAVSRAEGGSASAKTLDKIVAGTGLAGALDAWNAAYRSGERDPAKLQPLLTDLTWRFQTLDKQLASSFPMGTPAGEIAAGLKEGASVLTVEIAYEASELLRGTTPECRRLAGVTAAVDVTSVQGRTRTAAIMARDGKLGLGDFVAKTLRAFNKANWYTDLKAAADAWSVADTRDLASLATTTASFSAAMDTAATKVAGLTATATDQAFAAQNAIDALSYAVLDRINELAAIDPQAAKMNLFPQLSTALTKRLTVFDTPPDLASYWAKGKRTISGSPPTGLDLGTTLGRWQKVAYAGTPDPQAVAKATYPAIEAIADYRARIESGKLSPQDKAVLLRLLDTLLNAMSTRLTMLTG